MCAWRWMECRKIFGMETFIHSLFFCCCCYCAESPSRYLRLSKVFFLWWKINSEPFLSVADTDTMATSSEESRESAEENREWILEWGVPRLELMREEKWMKMKTWGKLSHTQQQKICRKSWLRCNEKDIIQQATVARRSKKPLLTFLFVSRFSLSLSFDFHLN